MSNPSNEQAGTVTVSTSTGRRPHVPINMHPTRMIQIAQAIASKPDATDDVRTLAAMVASLCHHVERASSAANRASSMGRRLGL